MSKNTKIVVGIIVGILLICCIGAAIAATILPRMASDFAEGAIIENPAQAAEIASSMVDYTLPPGFVEEGGMSILGIKTVFISSSAETGSAIVLMQFPAGMEGNEASMQQQMEDAFANQSGSQNYSVDYVSTETKTINGQPANLAFYEGTDDSGGEIRQVIGVFETKDGNTGMLMVIAPKNGWEQAGLERFLDSLR
jgi:hypothetical protein